MHAHLPTASAKIYFREFEVFRKGFLDVHHIA